MCGQRRLVGRCAPCERRVARSSTPAQPQPGGRGRVPEFSQKRTPTLRDASKRGITLRGHRPIPAQYSGCRPYPSVASGSEKGSPPPKVVLQSRSCRSDAVRSTPRRSVQRHAFDLPALVKWESVGLMGALLSRKADGAYGVPAYSLLQESAVAVVQLPGVNTYRLRRGQGDPGLSGYRNPGRPWGGSEKTMHRFWGRMHQALRHSRQGVRGWLIAINHVCLICFTTLASLVQPTISSLGVIYACHRECSNRISG